MKILMTHVCFCESMGYSDYFMCKHLAANGHEVHLAAGNIQLPLNNYEKTYGAVLGPNQTVCGTRQVENFTVHVLPVSRYFGRYYVHGLLRKVRSIKPDIILAYETVSMNTFKVIVYNSLTGYKFRIFTEDHVHLSVFPPAHEKARLLRRLKFWVYRHTVAWLINKNLEKCYVIAPDTEKIMGDYFGIDRQKMSLIPLASDTDWFYPAVTADDLSARAAVREKFGVGKHDILCIYTGRFSSDKNPQCLAEAIDLLQRQNQPYKAIFVGTGAAADVDVIASKRGCIIHPFVMAKDLPAVYRAADIGVWPKQESTSQLDAMATALPLVLSDHVQAAERTEGNALTYVENEPQSLVETLLRLKEADIRKRMGDCGRQKILAKLNWDFIAKSRLDDFAHVLENNTTD